MEQQEFVAQRLDYLRIHVQALIKYNKAVLIQGNYVHDNGVGKNYLTFRTIKPFINNASKSIHTLQICSHINVFNFLPYRALPFSIADDGKPFVCICRPYIYTDINGNKRGGLRLTNEFGIKPIANFQPNIRIFSSIPNDKLVNWFDFKEGKFVYVSYVNKLKEEDEKREKLRMRKTHEARVNHAKHQQITNRNKKIKNKRKKRLMPPTFVNKRIISLLEQI